MCKFIEVTYIDGLTRLLNTSTVKSLRRLDEDEEKLKIKPGCVISFTHGHGGWAFVEETYEQVSKMLLE